MRRRLLKNPYSEEAKRHGITPEIAARANAKSSSKGKENSRRRKAAATRNRKRNKSTNRVAATAASTGESGDGSGSTVHTKGRRRRRRRSTITTSTRTITIEPDDPRFSNPYLSAAAAARLERAEGSYGYYSDDSAVAGAVEDASAHRRRKRSYDEADLAGSTSSDDGPEPPVVMVTATGSTFPLDDNGEPIYGDAAAGTTMGPAHHHHHHHHHGGHGMPTVPVYGEVAAAANGGFAIPGAPVGASQYWDALDTELIGTIIEVHSANQTMTQLNTDAALPPEASATMGRPGSHTAATPPSTVSASGANSVASLSPGDASTVVSGTSPPGGAINLRMASEPINGLGRISPLLETMRMSGRMISASIPADRLRAAARSLASPTPPSASVSNPSPPTLPIGSTSGTAVLTDTPVKAVPIIPCTSPAPPLHSAHDGTPFSPSQFFASPVARHNARVGDLTPTLALSSPVATKPGNGARTSPSIFSPCIHKTLATGNFNSMAIPTINLAMSPSGPPRKKRKMAAGDAPTSNNGSVALRSRGAAKSGSNAARTTNVSMEEAGDAHLQRQRQLYLEGMAGEQARAAAMRASTGGSISPASGGIATV